MTNEEFETLKKEIRFIVHRWNKCNESLLVNKGLAKTECDILIKDKDELYSKLVEKLIDYSKNVSNMKIADINIERLRKVLV